MVGRRQPKCRRVAPNVAAGPPLKKDQRGAVLVEFAFVLPVVFTLVIGMLEFGLTFKDYLTVANATRAGARVGAAAGNTTANGGADYEILTAVSANSTALNHGSITGVVIYKAAAGSSALPAGCAIGGPSVANECNVYTAAQLQNLQQSQFGCGVGKLDNAWCPSNRGVSQSAGPDYLGIWVRVLRQERHVDVRCHPQSQRHDGYAARTDTTVIEGSPPDDSARTGVREVSRPDDKRDLGVVLVWFAFLLTAMLAMAAFAVDLGGWYFQSSELQKASDAAALAGVPYMPGDFPQAKSVALTTAKANGFDPNNPRYVVTVSPDPNPHRLDVSIKDTRVPVYFGKIFTNAITETRRSVAEYNLPIPLGSPENSFGTGSIALGQGGPSNIWAAVNGFCTAQEQGDLLLSRYDASLPGCQQDLRVPVPQAAPDWPQQPQRLQQLLQLDRLLLRHRYPGEHRHAHVVDHRPGLRPGLRAEQPLQQQPGPVAHGQHDHHRLQPLLRPGAARPYEGPDGQR